MATGTWAASRDAEKRAGSQPTLMVAFGRFFLVYIDVAWERKNNQ